MSRAGTRANSPHKLDGIVNRISVHSFTRW
jgi:hypothetical protein